MNHSWIVALSQRMEKNRAESDLVWRRYFEANSKLAGTVRLFTVFCTYLLIITLVGVGAVASSFLVATNGHDLGVSEIFYGFFGFLSFNSDLSSLWIPIFIFSLAGSAQFVENSSVRHAYKAHNQLAGKHSCNHAWLIRKYWNTHGRARGAIRLTVNTILILPIIYLLYIGVIITSFYYVFVFSRNPDDIFRLMVELTIFHSTMISHYGLLDIVLFVGMLVCAITISSINFMKRKVIIDLKSTLTLTNKAMQL